MQPPLEWCTAVPKELRISRSIRRTSKRSECHYIARCIALNLEGCDSQRFAAVRSDSRCPAACRADTWRRLGCPKWRLQRLAKYPVDSVDRPGYQSVRALYIVEHLIKRHAKLGHFEDKLSWIFFLLTLKASLFGWTRTLPNEFFGVAPKFENKFWNSDSEFVLLDSRNSDLFVCRSL